MLLMLVHGLANSILRNKAPYILGARWQVS
jgi:hypothetical protein